MYWLNKVVDELLARQPEGEIIIESGISPSGSYHMGYLREILTSDAVLVETRRRGRQARHIHFVDDQDALRKVPPDLPSDYLQYLGRPLCDIPAPDGSGKSYADYTLQPFLKSVESLGVEMEIMRSHVKYREGFFATPIEVALQKITAVMKVLEEVSGRKIDQGWSPIQVNEEGYLKKRPFVALDKAAKTIRYLDKEGNEQTVAYDNGQVKLDWRLDWPARWWCLNVAAEPFGRDHATKGGSYDTGRSLVEKVYGALAPIPVPYEFINRSGESKKMSASRGNGIDFSEVVQVLPPEVVRFFVLRSSPSKQLFFDPVAGVIRLIDEYAELLANPAKTPDEQQLIELCRLDLEPMVSGVPFSHLVASYQAALKDVQGTLDVLKRTEYDLVVNEQQQTIVTELKFIDQWLTRWAPEDVKFELLASPPQLDDVAKHFLNALADKVATAPESADGEWFHKAIYEVKEELGAEPKLIFESLYGALIGKSYGPRAGWFLSLLPRDWLTKRLRLES